LTGADSPPAPGAVALGSRQYGQLVERSVKLGGIRVHTPGTCVVQVLLTEAAAQESDREYPGTLCGVHVPNRIADDQALGSRETKLSLALDEKIGVRFGAFDGSAVDDQRFAGYSQGFERGPDLRPLTGGGNPMSNLGLAQKLQQRFGARQGGAVRKKLAEQPGVTLLQMLDVTLADPAPLVQSRNALDEQSAAESDAVMNLASRHVEAVFRQYPLPGDGMRIYGIDQGAVEIEDERFYWVPRDWSEG